MNDELIRELISVIKSRSVFSWDTVINILALSASWITIVFLLKERRENSRPYAQISFELIRSSLACIVIRNVGNVPLSVKSLEFNEEFIKQLNDESRKPFLHKEDISIDIFPGKTWVVCLGTTVFDIVENFELKSLCVKYKYSKIGKRKVQKDEIIIDFEQYKNFMVYVSEIDELKMEMSKRIKENTNELRAIKKNIITYCTLDNNMSKKIILKKDMDE